MATQVENTTAVAPPAGTSVSSGTASEAMIKAAEAASSPASTPAATPAGDTAKPAGAGTPASTAAASSQPVTPGQPSATGTGPTTDAPENRIIAAVRNARAEVERQYEPFKGLRPEDAQIIREMRTDVAGFIRRAAAELGLTVAEKAPAQAWKMPSGRLKAEDGTPAYSTEEVQEIINHMKEELIEQHIKPLSQFRDDTTRSMTMSQRIAEGRERVTNALTAARALPHFKDNEAAISAKIQAIDPQVRNQIGVVGVLHMAYAQVMAETVIPSIENGSAQRVREENERKAATSTGTVRPGGSGDGGKAPKLENVNDLAAHMARMAAAG